MKLLRMIFSSIYRKEVSVRLTADIINRHYMIDKALIDTYENIFIMEQRIAA